MVVLKMSSQWQSWPKAKQVRIKASLMGQGSLIKSNGGLIMVQVAENPAPVGSADNPLALVEDEVGLHHPLCARFTERCRASVSEATVRPNPRGRPAARRSQSLR